MSNQRQRVALIGGGATSALTAVRLAERGFAVTVLEKAAIGNGSSSRSNAGIRAQFGVEATVAGMHYSEDWYAHIHDHLATPAERRQPVIQQNGYLFLYEDPAAAAPAWQPAARAAATAAWELAQRNAAMQQRLGVATEVLTPAEVHARWPHLTPDRLIGATYCASDGFLRPHILLDEGYRRARELGVEVLTQAEVLGATLRGGRITALDTTRGAIEAEWYVNATNAWAPRVSRRIGGMPLPIHPTKRYLYHARLQRPILSDDELARQPMTIFGLGARRGAHTRPNGSQLILAWGHETAPEPDFADDDQDRIDPDFSHKHGLEHFGYAILTQIADFAPDLADALGITATTSGFYGVTPDADPLIGRDTQQANLLHAAGFSGHGLMHAPITAYLVEALLAGDVAPDNTVQLPPPFDHHRIALATFDPARDFTAHAESMVL